MPANTIEQVESMDSVAMVEQESSFDEAVHRETAKWLMNFVLRLKQQFVPEAAEPSPLASLPFLTLAQLDQLCKEQPVNYVVEGLLPSDDVHIAVGDSGLGKTAWAYQLGLCVASGRPFLDFSVREGRVLYFDKENGQEEIRAIGESLCSYLKIESLPKNFLVRNEEGAGVSLASAVEEYKPSLVIIDTLRAFQPNAEENNKDAGRYIQEWKAIARTEHCAILLLHHPRKPKAEAGGIPDLEKAKPLEWLHEASGARALINQTNTRIAFDSPRKNEAAALVMKYHVKVKGGSEAIYIERVYDPEGDPIGYKRMSGVGLLDDQHQRDAFNGLPGEFIFKDAKRVYGKGDSATNGWLRKCEAVGLVKQPYPRGPYRKVG
jgi:hypothetical protein